MHRFTIVNRVACSSLMGYPVHRYIVSISVRQRIHHAVRVFSWLRHTEGLSADGCPKMISIRSPVIN